MADDFACATAAKYRQTFFSEFCHDGVAYLSNGSLPRKNFSKENKIADVSCVDAVFTAAITLLEIPMNVYPPEEAAIFLYLYKQIILRRERQEKQCISFDEQKKIVSSHKQNLEALKENIRQHRKILNSFSIAKALSFFKGDEIFDLDKILVSKGVVIAGSEYDSKI